MEAEVLDDICDSKSVEHTFLDMLTRMMSMKILPKPRRCW